MAMPPACSPQILEFGDFTLDLRAGELVRRGGVRVLLPEQPFRVLVTLVHRPGELVTREDLQQELWSENTFVDFEHGLNSTIKRLREALGDSAVAPRYIETLPRRGYRFIASVAPVNGQGVDPSPAPDSATPSAPVQSRRRAKALAWGTLGAGALVVAAGLVVNETVWRAETPIIAVLPFKNLSPETESDVFVDGLTEEVIRNLAVIEGLEVRSRMSSFAFKDKLRDLADVREQLGVTHVIEGSVLGSGSRKRITVQLVEVGTDLTVWAAPFEREVTSSHDVFDILDEISRAIVNKLRLTLGRGQRRYDLDLELYERFLRGRSLIARRGIPSAEVAADLFQQVVARDPTFAPAHAGLANAYAFMMAPTSSRLAFAVAHPVLRAAAVKALELDPLLAEAHAAMGWVYSHEHDWASAQRSFEQAIRLNPSLTLTYTNYSISTLQPLGKFDAALAILRRAQRNDPLSLEVLREIGTVQLYAGRYAESIDTLQHVVTVDREYPFAELYLGRALTFAGRPAEALPLLERIDGRHLGRFKAPRGQRSVWLAQAYVMSGRRAEAEMLLEEHEDSDSSLAVIHAALGDSDRMFGALERMAVSEPHHVGRILLQPEIAARTDPRLVAFRARFNLTADLR
jgi:TolB-like protein/DNA-binding winged helix-turn-helix (wHTH) protein/Flp pilus assembly protein TadD